MQIWKRSTAGPHTLFYYIFGLTCIFSPDGCLWQFSNTSPSCRWCIYWRACQDHYWFNITLDRVACIVTYFVREFSVSESVRLMLKFITSHLWRSLIKLFVKVNYNLWTSECVHLPTVLMCAWCHLLADICYSLIPQSLKCFNIGLTNIIIWPNPLFAIVITVIGNKCTLYFNGLNQISLIFGVYREVTPAGVACFQQSSPFFLFTVVFILCFLHYV